MFGFPCLSFAVRAVKGYLFSFNAFILQSANGLKGGLVDDSPDLPFAFAIFDMSILKLMQVLSGVLSDELEGLSIVFIFCMSIDLMVTTLCLDPSLLVDKFSPDSCLPLGLIATGRFC